MSFYETKFRRKTQTLRKATFLGSFDSYKTFVVGFEDKKLKLKT